MWIHTRREHAELSKSSSLTCAGRCKPLPKLCDKRKFAEHVAPVQKHELQYHLRRIATVLCRGYYSAMQRPDDVYLDKSLNSVRHFGQSSKGLGRYLRDLFFESWTCGVNSKVGKKSGY